MENERIVHYLAARFRPMTTISAEDLVQVGYLGLIAAVERYEPDCGTCFITFAAPTIIGVIKHYLRDQSWGVKIPRRVRELATRLHHIRDELEQQMGAVPTPAQLAARIGISEEEILEAMEADTLYFTCSLDAHGRSGDEETGEVLQEVLGAPEPAYDIVMDRDAVSGVLAVLDERQRAIIESRFFGEMSQVQVAAALGISQMHVSRLERQSLRRLRELLQTREALE